MSMPQCLVSCAAPEVGELAHPRPLASSEHGLDGAASLSQHGQRVYPQITTEATLVVCIHQSVVS